MTDHLIPSAEDAALRFANLAALARSPSHGPTCGWCLEIERKVENAALALDMALAQASDRRRAADDELRRSVAW